MKTTVAFSVLAAISMAAIPATAGADCMGYHQSKLVRSSAPAPVAAASATETANPQTAEAKAPTATSVSKDIVADLSQPGMSPGVKAE